MPQTLSVAQPFYRLRGPRLAVVALTTASVLVGVPVANTPPAAAAVDHRLQSRLTSVLNDTRTKRAKTGGRRAERRTPARCSSAGTARAVMPASNAKIVTAVAALHMLGPDSSFSTEVLRRAGSRTAC